MQLQKPVQRPCFICAHTEAQLTSLDKDENLVACPRCGKFLASGLFIAGKSTDLTSSQIGNISSWIREQQYDRALSLDEYGWDFLKSIDTPSIGEKAEKLLIYLSKKFPQANQKLAFDNADRDISSCWAANWEEASYLFHDYLVSYKNFIQQVEKGGHPFVISPAGWDYLHSLRYVHKGSSIGFCAMWFDARLEPLWSDAIHPAIEGAGYEPKRIDKHQHNNRIDDEIMVMIRRSRFVIADYTGNRGGVYFEAGFALGLGIPVIWTCRHSRLRKVHFDTRQYNFVTWDGDDLPGFKQRLQNRIETTIINT